MPNGGYIGDDHELKLETADCRRTHHLAQWCRSILVVDDIDRLSIVGQPKGGAALGFGL